MGEALSGAAGEAVSDGGRRIPRIEVRDVYFHYTAGLPVLKGVSLDLGPGATAVIGQNGAGKSTFARLLNGLLKPVSGEVRVGGVSTRGVTVATLARSVGLVFQNPSDQLFRNRVLDELTFGPLNLGVSREEAVLRARRALAEVGLEGRAERHPYDLGLAERKLVTVASVLTMQTPVVILDEPTIAQDRSAVRQLGEIILRLRDAGRMVLTISHDMDFVARYFRRLLVFKDGEVFADGDVASLFGQVEMLAEAGLAVPQITRLGQALGLSRTVLSAEEFAAVVSRQKRPPSTPMIQN